MVAFVPGQEVRTDAPIVVVDPGLKAGTYRFQLVVVDDSGNVSAPAFLSMTVRSPLPPPPPPPPSSLDPTSFTKVTLKPGPLNPRNILER